MKRLTSLLAGTLFLLGTLNVASAYGAPAPTQEPSNTGDLTSIDKGKVTGCLQPADTAREYTIRDSDGNAWEVFTDGTVYLNSYVGKTVTITGDILESNAQPNSSQGTSQRLHATSVVVNADTCEQ